MEFKIDFPDIVLYLVPGGLTVILIFWFLHAFVAMPYDVNTANLGVVVTFLIVSYVAGNISQALGNMLEAVFEWRWGGKYSDLLLRDDPNDPNTSNTLAGELRRRVVDDILTVFNVTVPTDASPEKRQDRKAFRRDSREREQAFHLCYSLLLQEDAAQHAIIFQSRYGLYRGLLATEAVGIMASLLVIGKHIVLYASAANSIPVPAEPFFAFDAMQLVSGILLCGAFFLTWPLLSSRLHRFAKRYAATVYESFHAWCSKHAVSSLISVP